MRYTYGTLYATCMYIYIHIYNYLWYYLFHFNAFDIYIVLYGTCCCCLLVSFPFSHFFLRDFLTPLNYHDSIFITLARSLSYYIANIFAILLFSNSSKTVFFHLTIVTFVTNEKYSWNLICWSVKKWERNHIV